MWDSKRPNTVYTQDYTDIQQRAEKVGIKI